MNNSNNNGIPEILEKSKHITSICGGKPIVLDVVFSKSIVRALIRYLKLHGFKMEKQELMKPIEIQINSVSLLEDGIKLKLKTKYGCKL